MQNYRQRWGSRKIQKMMRNIFGTFAPPGPPAGSFGDSETAASPDARRNRLQSRKFVFGPRGGFPVSLREFPIRLADFSESFAEIRELFSGFSESNAGFREPFSGVREPLAGISKNHVVELLPLRLMSGHHEEPPMGSWRRMGRRDDVLRVPCAGCLKIRSLSRERISGPLKGAKCLKPRYVVASCLRGVEHPNQRLKVAGALCVV